MSTRQELETPHGSGRMERDHHSLPLSAVPSPDNGPFLAQYFTHATDSGTLRLAFALPVLKVTAS